MQKNKALENGVMKSVVTSRTIIFRFKSANQAHVKALKKKCYIYPVIILMNFFKKKIFVGER